MSIAGSYDIALANPPSVDEPDPIEYRCDRCKQYTTVAYDVGDYENHGVYGGRRTRYERICDVCVRKAWIEAVRCASPDELDNIAPFPIIDLVQE